MDSVALAFILEEEAYEVGPDETVASGHQYSLF